MSKDYFVIDFLRFTGYTKSLKITGGYRPRQIGGFFLPKMGDENPNILNKGQRPVTFSESPTFSFFKVVSKNNWNGYEKINKRTTNGKRAFESDVSFGYGKAEGINRVVERRPS